MALRNTSAEVGSLAKWLHWLIASGLVVIFYMGLEQAGMDYVTTARAKGVTESRIVFVHVLRNALLPVVTILGLQMGALLGGAVLTETVFGLAGVGRMLFEAITARDYPIIQAFTVVIAVAYMLINLVVDVSYGFLDPRIRLE